MGGDLTLMANAHRNPNPHHNRNPNPNAFPSFPLKDDIHLFRHIFKIDAIHLFVAETV